MDYRIDTRPAHATRIINPPTNRPNPLGKPQSIEGILQFGIKHKPWRSSQLLAESASQWLPFLFNRKHHGQEFNAKKGYFNRLLTNRTQVRSGLPLVWHS